RLKEIAKSGFSPSSLTNYLYNPIAFYKQKILKIKEFDDVEETVAYNTLGTIVHETLDKLYQPFVGKYLQKEDVVIMQTKAKDLVVKYFKIEFKNGDISTGKNRLIFEVANRFVSNFLSKEIVLLKDKNNQLKIIATEENLAAEITIDGIDFPIKLHGNVDRVDELNGEIRIIDYKSGMVKSSELKVTDFEELRPKEQYKAIQVLLYAYLFTKNKKFDFSKNLKGGIYSFKNLNEGFLSINFSSNYRNPETNITQEKLEEFIVQLEKYILEIFNVTVPFIAPADLKY
ncbi:MAG: PD-(D/E)XK nuclease family protein, partial [Polaribacter sp.]